MAKITLSDLTNLENQSSSIATINANMALIEDAMEITLSRDGTTPNTMATSLDMNSNRILNLPEPLQNDEPARLADIGNSPVYAAEAAASAAAALSSETAASSSASSASSSASAASSSASAASSSASSASSSASSASSSASSAAASALVYPGYKYTWSTSTTNADPTSGNLKLNNATVASATALYISETDANSNNLATVISGWGSSSSTAKAVLRIMKSATNYIEVTLTTSVTDNGAWDTFTVTGGALTGSAFSNGDTVYLYSRITGDAGTGSVSGMTNHGIALASGATTISTSTAVMTDGQLLVGQSAADPLPKTLSGDATMAASGAITLADASGTRTNLGLGTASNPQFATIELGAASDTTLARVSAGVISVEGSTVPTLSVANTWTGVQGYAFGTLTYNATQTWDVSTNPVAALAPTGNITSFSVSGATAGRMYVLKITQDTSARTIAYTAANFKFIGGSAPTLSAGSGAIDYITFIASTSTLLHEVGRAQNIS